MKKLILILFTLYVATATLNAQSVPSFLRKMLKEKYYTTDINMKAEGGEICAYYNNKRFTGTVYSLDESCNMVFNNGVVTKAVGFHVNGKQFFTAEFPFNERIIWIYSENGVGLIKATYRNGKWNFYNMQKPDENNMIPWISSDDCIGLLREHRISLSTIESCFKKLPDIGYCPSMIPYKTTFYPGEYIGNIYGNSGGTSLFTVELKLYVKIVANEKFYQVKDSNGDYYIVNFGRYTKGDNYYNAKAGSYYMYINL